MRDNETLQAVLDALIASELEFTLDTDWPMGSRELDDLSASDFVLDPGFGRAA
ncbi:MAG: hypothetical protein QM765_40060 [Myxococcales bacterium]